MAIDAARPAYHFTPARNWMNDPNGLVWLDGEYHLFFQHNPDGCDPRDIGWGHAVSRDLASWEELPVALRATEQEQVFSGCVVVDHADSSGLGADGVPALVAVYTGHDSRSGRQTQCLASSVDRGRTWVRHPANPVLDVGSTDFRDPKVFWYADGGHWVMVVALAVERKISLYRSDDLVRWEHLSDFGPRGAVSGVWECPDLFPLPVDGDPADVRWLLVVSVQSGAPAGGSGMQCFVGDFDGRTFTADVAADPEEVAWVDFGADYYAAVSFDNVPDGRRILVGWMGNWDYAREIPTVGYRGAMAVPRVWELRRTGAWVRLVQHPLLPHLAEPVHRVGPAQVGEGLHPLPSACHGSELVIVAELEAGSADRFGLLVRRGEGESTAIGYDVGRGCVYVDRTGSGVSDFHPSFASIHAAALDPGTGVVRLEVLVDRTSVEVFAGEGEVVITDQVFPRPDSRGTALFAEGGAAELRSLTVTQAGRSSPTGPATAATGQRSSSLSSRRETT